MAGTLTTYAQCKLQVSRMKLNICDSAQFLRGGVLLCTCLSIKKKCLLSLTLDLFPDLRLSYRVYKTGIYTCIVMLLLLHRGYTVDLLIRPEEILTFHLI